MNATKSGIFNKGFCLILITLILLIMIAGCSHDRTAKVEQQAESGPQQIDPNLSPDLDKIMANIHAVAA